MLSPHHLLAAYHMPTREVLEHHFILQMKQQQHHPRLREVEVVTQSPLCKQWRGWDVNEPRQCDPRTHFLHHLLYRKAPTSGRYRVSRQGKREALTFLVLPGALCEEQLVLPTWEVGWKNLIHEGAGKKTKQIGHHSPSSTSRNPHSQL